MSTFKTYSGLPTTTVWISDESSAVILVRICGWFRVVAYRLNNTIMPTHGELTLTTI